MRCDGCKWKELSGYDFPCCDCSRIEREDLYEDDAEEDYGDGISCE